MSGTPPEADAIPDDVMELAKKATSELAEEVSDHFAGIAAGREDCKDADLRDTNTPYYGGYWKGRDDAATAARLETCGIAQALGFWTDDIPSIIARAVMADRTRNAPDTGSDREAQKIGDAILDWMVRYDLLDGDNEYQVADVMAVMDDLVPVEQIRNAHDSGGTEPVAWEWRQLMLDSMGGWEHKVERRQPPSYVEPDRIRDLRPLYTTPPSPAASPACGGEVRTLDWEECGDDELIADTICGRYLVGLVHSSYRLIFIYIDRDNVTQTVIAEGLGLEAAKARAHEHFASYIRSALLKDSHNESNGVK